MSEYRYSLERYKTPKDKYKCPNCDKKTFTRYVDMYTNNEHLHETVGICNRKIKCNYHYPPKQYFKDNNLKTNINYKSITKPKKKEIKKTSFIDKKLLLNSLDNSKTNKFIRFLETELFGAEATKQVVENYRIGTSNHWDGATIFWQIDEANNIRSGKIMQYNEYTGKRVKKPINLINWVHKTEMLKNFNLEQCYFGLHLINLDKDKPIAIVESEKTAVIASVYLPEFIWIACGSVSNLSAKNTEALKGRDVVLFPDLNCYQLWKDKAAKFSLLIFWQISNLLENNASPEEKEQGYDLADYLINLQIDFKKHI